MLPLLKLHIRHDNIRAKAHVPTECKKIMCLYPRFIINRKYTNTKKNGYNAPELTDERIKQVPIGCGMCIECRKQKAQAWRIRLMEEVKRHKGYFITLSFSPEELEKLCKETNLQECNAVATIAVRRFLERWRKKYKKSVKHWLITELGHNNTERIHLHGILFTEIKEGIEQLEDIWKYGNVYVGNYCTEKTINYVIKYMLKVDDMHKNFRGVVLCSAGLGKEYITKASLRYHTYKGEDTHEEISLPNGAKVNLPIYYRNKVFTEDEREKLWLHKLDKNTIYVMGIKCEHIDTKEGYENYMRILKEHQGTNRAMGYGDLSEEWREKDYNITLKMLNKKK